MQTRFTPDQLADPATAASEAIIRKCVHCGFCTATCPTYVLLGDELDSPRGRIYLMKEMIESDATPSAEVVKHVDRCLSCLSCMTTCPSGVNYMHLVDHARSYIERRYRRPIADRLFRGLLAAVLPYPRRFRAAIGLARLARPLLPAIRPFAALRPLAAMLTLAPGRRASTARGLFEAVSSPRGRVALLEGCAEPVLRPEIRAATRRLLARLGYEVISVPGEGCCGALVQHLGREEAGLTAARRNVDAWCRVMEQTPLDAIIVTASGCGTMLKDYGFMLRNDPDYAGRASRISSLARDVSEFLAKTGLPECASRDVTVAYHPACSLQHGQKILDAPKVLLERAGFRVRLPSEAHLCCGSAGTYNILQPEIASRLADRKVAAIEPLGADVIATGNIGCATQIAQRATLPVVHTVELLDWATGGPCPMALKLSEEIQR